MVSSVSPCCSQFPEPSEGKDPFSNPASDARRNLSSILQRTLYQRTIESDEWPSFALDNKETPFNLRELLQLGKISAGDIVFDLGAGPPAAVQFFLMNRCRVVAVDSFRGFERFMDPLRIENRDALTVKEQEISEDVLPKDSSVSLIMAHRTLKYCAPTSVLPIVEAAHASLKKGGILSVSFCDYEILVDAMKKQLSASSQTLEQLLQEEENNAYASGYWFLKDRDAMRNALEEIGFRILNVAFVKDESVFICQKPS